MEDKFLYELREMPRPQFAERLYQRLEIGRSHPVKHWKSAWAVLLTLFILAAGVMGIPPVRAAVLAYFERIGGLPFEVTTDYPGDNDADVTILTPRRLPLEEAFALSPFPIHLPSGVNWESETDVYQLDGATLNFSFLLHGYTADGKWISLSMLTNPNTVNGEIIAPGAAETVYLDAEHPAALIRGGWDYDKKTWTYTYGQVRVKWQLDGVEYDLSALQMDAEVLLEIARSTLP